MSLSCLLKAAVLCPLCERTRKNFAPMGIVAKRKAYCPSCKSFDRHRHFWHFLKNEKPEIFKEKLTLLHWAPEDCLSVLLEKYENLTYIRGDIDRPNDPKILKLDITNTDLPDKSVDVVFCNHVLEHIPDDHLALTEIVRVLKPGGYALIMVPLYIDQEKTYEDFSITSPEDRVLHFDQEDHVRRYGLDFIQRLKKAGFIVKHYPLARLPKSLREKYGMAGHDTDVKINAARGADIFLCTKA